MNSCFPEVPCAGQVLGVGRFRLAGEDQPGSASRPDAGTQWHSGVSEGLLACAGCQTAAVLYSDKVTDSSQVKVAWRSCNLDEDTENLEVCANNVFVKS